jgi:tRNA(fMet)-specific endonuclease VapC
LSFLIDTDVCSAHLRQSPAVTSKFLHYTGRLHISALTVGELYTWASRAGASPQRLQSLLDLLDDATVLDVSETVGQKFGEVRAGLLDVGKPAPSVDLFIAATALVHDLTLVTHNVRDFLNVPGLRIDDWLAP